MTYEEPIYIFGHQHPDTDSIASAVAYSFFKRAMGVKAIPCRLGDINNETRYLLERFQIEEPVLLRDTRKTLADIELDPPTFISEDTTALDAIKAMNGQYSSIAVVDDNKKLIGFVSKSDLANIGLGDTASEIELLKHTEVKYICSAINGRMIYDDPDTHINGKVSIVALTKTGTANYDVEGRIVIVGDEPSAQLDLIRRGAGALVVVWADSIVQEVVDEAKVYHCPIMISGHGTMNTSRYIFLAPPAKLFMTKNPVSFQKSILIEDAEKKMQRTRFKSYPVVERDGTLAGYVTRFHILGYKNKKVIMVDHNEFSQSARCVEKAQILEVVDHHRINDFATSQPVSFRNEIVGSTATIIATMFRENQIPLTPNLAGILLGAILSDTLLFQSPTTTKKDRTTANILAAVANLDVEEFGREMFEATAAAQERSIHEMIVQDIKYYEINGVHTMISQAIVSDLSEIRTKEKEILRDMNVLVEKKDIGLLVAAFTSIIEDGSIFFAAGERAEACQIAFPDGKESYTLQKGILSRKGQILPKLTEVIESM